MACYQDPASLIFPKQNRNLFQQIRIVPVRGQSRQVIGIFRISNKHHKSVITVVELYGAT